MLTELIKQRQSCRSFDENKDVSNEDLQKILANALLSPSARNKQPYKLYVTNKDSKKRTNLIKACQEMGANKFLTNAPVLITIVKEKQDLTAKLSESLVKVQDFRPIDIGILTAHIVLLAKEQCIDSIIIGWLNEKKIISALELDKNSEVCLVIGLGYQTEDYPLRDKVRADFDKKVFYK